MSPMNVNQATIAIREARRMIGDVDVIETDITNNDEASLHIGDECPSPHKQWLDEHDMNDENIIPSTREERKNRDCLSRVPRATVAISKKCFRM